MRSSSPERRKRQQNRVRAVLLTEHLCRLSQEVPEGAVIYYAIYSLWRNTEGQDVAEYAIMLAIVLVLVTGMVRLIGVNASAVFSQVGSAIQ